MAIYYKATTCISGAEQMIYAISCMRKLSRSRVYCSGFGESDPEAAHQAATNCLALTQDTQILEKTLIRDGQYSNVL